MSAKKGQPVQTTKGKDAELQKWEAEVRKSLATKKKPALSKQDQALVQAQLEKESQVRKRINAIQERLRRGLRIIKHLVAGNVMGFSAWVSVVAELLIEGGSLEKGKVLVGEEGFDTYLVSLTDHGSGRCEGLLMV